MDIEGWKYYNHAAIPVTPPHIKPDMRPLEDGSIWKMSGGMPLLACYTIDFDSNQETNWWYVIKDTPFDISLLKSKRRYEINKGIKYFDVKKIDPRLYKEDIYRVQVEAFSAYPKKYRPTVNKKCFFKEIDDWTDVTVFGAFFRDTNELNGYALLTGEKCKYVDFKVMKSNPIYEKYSVNAAIVEGIVKYYACFLSSGGYLCDGSRSVNHETAFQEYLEKYFGFRKAYGRLRIVYNPKIKWLIKLLFPLRKLFFKFDSLGPIHRLNSVFRMEEISRKDN